MLLCNQLVVKAIIVYFDFEGQFISLNSIFMSDATFLFFVLDFTWLLLVSDLMFIPLKYVCSYEYELIVFRGATAFRFSLEKEKGLIFIFY